MARNCYQQGKAMGQTPTEDNRCPLLHILTHISYNSNLKIKVQGNRAKQQ